MCNICASARFCLLIQLYISSIDIEIVSVDAISNHSTRLHGRLTEDPPTSTRATEVIIFVRGLSSYQEQGNSRNN